MGMILRIASSRIVGQGDIVGRSGYFSLNLSANSVMRGRLDARRTLKSLVAELRFNMLRYQVVKYFGLFNLLYKQFESTRKGVNVDEVNGIEALLLRLEYSADTRLGRQVSDIGASFNVVKYYDVKENNPDDRELIGKYYNQLDDYEKYNVARIDQIL